MYITLQTATSADEINKIEYEIISFYEIKRKRIETRARETRLKLIFQPSKVLIEKELNRGKENRIQQFRLMNGDITTETELMLDNLHVFYSNLLGKERVNSHDIENFEFSMKTFQQVARNININYEFSYYEA